MWPDLRQTVVALDLEGVLIPEIWIAVAEHTGIDALRRTTRDEPDYNVLMRGRLALLERHGLRLPDITSVIAQLEPLAGAHAFLDGLRSLTQVIIVSDTFEQFAQPFMRRLGWPTIFCHRLIIGDDQRIIDYQLRQDDQKRRTVEALHSLNYHVAAAGDSYNDIAMLRTADIGVLFRSPERVQREFPQFAAVESYDELATRLLATH